MTVKQFPCNNCGAAFEYTPGTEHLSCPYCGSENHIPQSEQDIVEQDFHTTLAQLAASHTVERSATVTCQSCHAEFTLAPNTRADECPFCSSAVVSEPGEHEQLPATALIPFKLSARQARERFQLWLQGLWFAPNKVKRYARAEDGFSGIYLPFWTFDSRTSSGYRGQRGDHYYVQTRGSDGKARRERRTRWRSASGTVGRAFDDVLIVASESLPKTSVEALEPWPLAELTAYQQDYLSGFRAETYQIDLEQGFSQARAKMDQRIRSDVRRDIGGDQQRIEHISTQHDAVTFKHVLLPIYLAAFRYQDKIYRFMINGCTGEVQGERPYSWVKIGLAATASVVVLGVLVYLLNR
jgi:DNA-directed RNA polymerase subunit RPC12/RpoP